MEVMYITVWKGWHDDPQYRFDSFRRETIYERRRDTLVAVKRGRLEKE